MRGSVVSLTPRGGTITRMARCLLLAKDDGLPQASALAEATYGAASDVARILRAATEAGSLVPAQSWGAELALMQLAVREFFGLVVERSLVGGLAGMRRVPLNVRLGGVVGGVVANWTGALKPRPFSSAILDSVMLPARTITADVVVSDDLVRRGGPEAEALLTAELVRACAEFLDAAMFDPAAAEVPDVSPASLTNGADPIPSAGNPADDLASVVGAFAGDLLAAYFVSHPNVATQLALARDASGAFLFPDVGPRGGSVLGIPLLTSRAIPWTSAGGPLVLVDPSGVAFGGGSIELATAHSATVQMDSAPDDPPTGGTVMVSLWQNNLLALRATLRANFAKLRPGAVAYVENAAYFQGTS